MELVALFVFYVFVHLINLKDDKTYQRLRSGEFPSNIEMIRRFFRLLLYLYKYIKHLNTNTKDFVLCYSLKSIGNKIE